MVNYDIERRRDRMAALLAPWFGDREARERASDIAQVLLCEERGAVEVAGRVLRGHLPGPVVGWLALRVGAAWTGTSRMTGQRGLA